MAASRSRSPRKRTRRSRDSEPIVIRGDVGDETRVDVTRQLESMAMRWRYKLTKRARWKDRVSDEMEVVEADLRDLDPKLRSAEGEILLPWLDRASLVEVAIPYREEEVGWGARIAPWEFLLASASRHRGRTGDFSVVRHLQRSGRRRAAPGAISKVLYLECAPAELREHYDFEAERQVVERRFDGTRFETLVSPTPAQLRRKISEFGPHVVHVAGIDSHQARELLSINWDLAEDWGSLDGVALSDGDGWVEVVPALDFARLLNAGRTKPRLVFLNVFHSASRIASLCVGEGTQYAIGYQDTVDDELSEMLLSEFYLAWKAADWQVLPAFVEAVAFLRRAPKKLTGTGIVLWSEHSLLDDQAAGLPKWKRNSAARRRKPIRVRQADYDWLEISIEPNDALNYSLMHNDARGLFARFGFRKFKEGTLRDVHVDVNLHVGGMSFPYRRTLELVDPFTPIEDEIKVPLTSDLVRTVQEPLKTSVFAEVRHGDVILRRDTWRVTLLPADEWVDDDENRLWLPAFVLPRDPAISRIIETAQSHLMTLADDRTRGFDGYQSVVPGDPDSLDDLDIQVQSIWAALVHHYGVKYINPPPSYSESGQRLRTPGQVLRGGRGTCIDLALLLAACLEYVDVHPVVFLLEGHAFVGYWRSEQAYEDFTFGRESDDDAPDGDRITPTGDWDPEAAWVVPAREYPGILRQINDGGLYPIESVGLTTHGSFWQAVEEGMENLRDRAEFHSMVDVKRARENSLTPLPLKEVPGDGA